MDLRIFRKVEALVKQIKVLERDLVSAKSLMARVGNKKDDIRLIIEIDFEDTRIKLTKTKALEIIAASIEEMEDMKEKIEDAISEL